MYNFVFTNLISVVGRRLNEVRNSNERSGETVMNEVAEQHGANLALGLMSGTSMDGIDACLLETDGENIVRAGASLFQPYDDAFRARLRAVIADQSDAAEVANFERDMTIVHSQLVTDLLGQAELTKTDIRVIGFHGHTIAHAPAPGRPGQGRTVQLGDGALLAAQTGIDIVGNFRSQDVAAGGEGAPLAPIYHAALADDLVKPVCVLNIGGVANVTWIGEDGALVAFDTGPGNALIDDFVRRRTGAACDQDGALAAVGAADMEIVAAYLAGSYFARPAPKSLDRNDFSGILKAVETLSTPDGVATLTELTVGAVVKAAEILPSLPDNWVVTGGGRKNTALMSMLAAGLTSPVAPAESFAWDGDMLEAQAFAYLAVRCLRGLPISFPGTTGVPRPMTGATHYPAG